jgi:ferredoxin
MAYRITDKCEGCAVCLSVCPNHAITVGFPKFRINPYLCTECVGYADEPRCAEACPSDGIVKGKRRAPMPVAR